MQIFTDTNVNFMKLRTPAMLISGLLAAVSLVAMVTEGFNFGIDFRGGSELEFKFVDDVEIGALRNRLGALGLSDLSLQRVGERSDHTILVRARTDEEEAGHISKAVVQTLLTDEDKAALAAGRLNLNAIGEEDLAAFLATCAVPEGTDRKRLADAIVAARTSAGVFASYAELDAVPGVTPEIRSCVEAGTFLPDFSLWKDYFVGPKVGAELRRGAYWAIGFSLAGILAYIWWRFQVQYGIGAVLALFHDVIITTGMLVLLREEFTLTVVAALLTLAGYSVNDTIVVFDRIRENLRVMRNQPLEEVINRSLNQTLSRTVLTAATTLLVVLTMLLFGGAEFRGFALALFIGIVLGTYSSIFIASPLVLIWQGYFVRSRSRRVARA